MNIYPRKKDIRDILEVTQCSPYLWAFFWTPKLLFQWYSQTKEILFNLGMKCWNSAFNAQGSRIVIVGVQVGVVKIYVATVEVLMEKERQYETHLRPKLMVL